MKTLLSVVIILATLPAIGTPKTTAVKAKGDEFKGKFLFTHLPKAHSKKDDVSKCFKFNKPSKEVLQTYHQCRQDPKLASPLEEAVGTCIRNDGANAYFFEDMQECESARTEIIDTLSEQ